MTANDRKYATFVALTTLSLTVFAAAASASRAAPHLDRPPISVVLALHGRKQVVRTQAATVGDLLRSRSIALNPQDEVSPAVGHTPREHETIRIVRVRTWTAEMREKISAPVYHRLDSNLPDYASRTISAGRPGLRLITVRVVKRDGARPRRQRVASRILSKPRARIVFDGVGKYVALPTYAKRGFGSVSFLARRRRMIATAYTPGCDGCSGITKTGIQAGHGIVAVDPRYIPLGTKLYVPGYGRALAADIGGAIQGRRIDLGFDSLRAAQLFGRREIVVYVLR